MKGCYKYLILALLCLMIGILTQHNILFPRFNHAYAKRFQNVFAQKEKEILDIIKPLADTAAQDAKKGSGNFANLNYSNLLKDRGLGVFIYQRDTLRYWSDNLVPIATNFSKSGIDSTFIYIKNAWFVPRVIRKNNTVVVGLILIKQVYQYENKQLETKFQDDFTYPLSVKIASKMVSNSFPIVDSNGNYLFSLVFDQSTEYPFYENTLPSICYILFFLFFLWFGFRFIQSIQDNSLRHKTIFAFAIFVFGLKVYMIYNQLPHVFYSEKMSLFDPLYFAASEFMPSLGDLLIWAIIIMYFVLVFDKCYDLSGIINRFSQKPKQKIIHLTIHVSLALLFFYWAFYLIKSVIINSTISFEINKLLTFDIFGLIGYLIIVLLLASFSFYFDKILRNLKVFYSYKEFILVFVSVTIVLGGILYLADVIAPFPLLFFVLL